MSDRFKFRAFINGEMIGPDRLAFEEYDLLADQLESEPCLMQSTGLRDKNGVLIFEGDVITATPDEPEDEPIIHVIKFEDQGYWVPVHNYYEYELTSLAVAINHCPWYVYEVIGNIYENPELVEA